MELTDLRYFLNVTETRSFAEGARRSHVSPPAISKAIRKLEDELGAMLFARTTRRIVLTDQGELLRARARRIFEEVDGMRRDLDDAGAALRGELRVGAMEVFSIFLLPRAITGLVQKHPAIVPQCHEVIPGRLEALLAEGRLDVGFTIGGGAPKAIELRVLGRSAGVLVCGRGHPLYAKGRVRPPDLRRHPSVVPRFLGMEHLPVLDQFPERAHPRAVGATIELLQMGVQLAIDGAYLGYFPEISVRPYLEDGRLRRLEGLRQAAPFELCAWTRGGFAPRAAVKALIDEVADLVTRVRGARS